MRLNTIMTAAAPLMLAGCHLSYSVTMTPDGNSLRRETTVSSEIEPHEISELTDVFGSPERTTDPDETSSSKTTLTFHGAESGESWANGFGGQGSWRIIDTPIGTARCFVECLGGETHIADDLMAVQGGIDAVEAFVRRRLRTSLTGHRLMPKMLTLIRDRIAPDARDLVVMGWAMVFAHASLPPEARSAATRDLESRLHEAAIAFLWQRDWITSTEAAAFIGEDFQAIELVFPKILARALGMNMHRDWQEQMMTLVKELGEVIPEDINEQLIEVFTEAVGEHTQLAVAWAATTAFLTSRKVTVRLNADSPPATTNGQWNANLGAVEWQLDSAPLAVGITAPPLCWSATWATPNSTAQDSILGHVGITGEDLSRFCLAWSLSSPQQHDDVRDVLNSYARARSGTDIEADAPELLRECMALLHAAWHR
ncbi:MAG: hypothetical protein QGG74_05710 [Phycisphaerales bacterium]|jgi:hypothetical protein|nr:hypothetical protein [Phycisphaerales bacterium]MDP6987523.1 hypothetical protein [Phycisphaerales bacterium]